MKVIITGGRDYKDKLKLFDVLNKINPTEVKVGDCPTGADRFVLEWEKELKPQCSFQIYRANWDDLGKAAGPVRNKQMVEDHKNADFLLAFPGNRGTEDCIKHAKNNSVIILRVEV